MVENLKTTRYRNGDVIPNVTSTATWASLTSGAYCDYNNDEKLSVIYGRIYNRQAVEDNRKIVPAGWRVAVSEDWNILREFLGDHCYQRMQATGTTHWIAGNENADNISGFTALPSGRRNRFGFEGLGYVSSFWSSGSQFPDVAFGQNEQNRCDAFRSTHSDDGMAIRCIKE